MARGAGDRAVQQSRSRMSPDAIAALLQTWGYPLWNLLVLKLWLHQQGVT